MILTEEFINRQSYDGTRELFELATSLGYTILCPEDETGSLRRGFMLQNQNGAIYTCSADETTVETMVHLLRFILDFDRATPKGVPAQPSRMGQLEERVSALERRLDMLTGTAEEDISAAQDQTSDSDYEHYLELFQEKQPEFEAAGIELTIDTRKRQVRYRNLNTNRRSICYKISQLGYKRATDALRFAKISQGKND